jgi:hypothetical protein
MIVYLGQGIIPLLGAQGVTIAARNEWTLEEAWIQQYLFGNRFSILSKEGDATRPYG